MLHIESSSSTCSCFVFYFLFAPLTQSPSHFVQGAVEQKPSLGELTSPANVNMLNDLPARMVGEVEIC